MSHTTAQGQGHDLELFSRFGVLTLSVMIIDFARLTHLPSINIT